MRWWLAHGYDHGEQMVGIPLIPAPIAFFAMMFGLMIGVMIGRKKSMMHGMQMGSECCGSDWMSRNKMMGMHHHHGDGMSECKCGESSRVSGTDQERTAGA